MPLKRKYNSYCESCNNELVMKNGKYPKRFCSLKCSQEYCVGINSWNYKNGIVKSDTYTRILISGKKRYMLEHRYLMEKAIGRKLKSDEHVHHIDGNKSNNNLLNLSLMSAGEHIRLHHIGKPNRGRRKFPIFIELPEPKTEGKIVSILPEYRTYITILCSGCSKLHWIRKDHLSRQLKPSCSSRCGHIVKGHNVNA